VARALWGTPLVDRHVRGAIRSHLHTLRAKLRAAGLDGTVESKPGVGYRLILEAER
jgi:DNA-binding response OmpR family regulator